MTRAARLAAAAAVFATVTACGGSVHAEQPKPAGWQIIRVGSQRYSDVATFCDHGNRVYLPDASTPQPIAVVGQDPTCKDTPR